MKFAWQNPCGATYLYARRGFRITIASLVIEVWFNYPQKRGSR